MKERKIILFDLFGTLCDLPISNDNWYDINYRGIKAALQKVGIADLVKKDEFEKICHDFINDKAKLRKIAKTDLLEFEIKKQIFDFLEKIKHIPGVEEKIGIIKNDDRLLREIEYLFVVPEIEITYELEHTLETLQELSKDHDLYLVSNNVSRVLVEEGLKKLGLHEDIFKRIFVSADIGYRKPHDKFIEHVVKAISVDKEKCIMIGDRLTQDILLANNHGMIGIYLSMRDHEDNKGAEEIKSHHTIKKITELKKIIEKL